MRIVLLESLGVSDGVIEKHAQKLENMGHSFTAYEKNTDPAVQVECCRNADAVMLANMPLSEAVIDKAEHLKFIDVAFTGVDHIPMEAARKKGIAVSNASGYATQAVAELCVSFMIQLLRNVNKTEKRCRTGGTKDGLIGNLLCGKTVGIVGAGAIGKRTAALCKAFGCTVLAYNRSKITDASVDRQVSLEELLSSADIVSLHCPLTEETRGLVGRKLLALMKPTAFLINTARGALVDELALAEALDQGRLAGAGLDVLTQEPPEPGNPLLSAQNCVITPHVAWAAKEARERLIRIVAENLRRYQEGRPQNVVS